MISITNTSNPEYDIVIDIVNVSDEDAPNLGLNYYELRLDEVAVTNFTHNRKVDGLSSCLRGAASAAKDLKPGDKHTTIDNYAVKINNSPICTFKFNRSSNIHELLTEAAKANDARKTISTNEKLDRLMLLIANNIK